MMMQDDMELLEEEFFESMTPNQENMIRISKEIDFANGFIDPSYFEKIKEEVLS